MDDIDRTIINRLQNGFPLAERPFAAAAAMLGMDETELMKRIASLLESGTLTRFGPLFQIERIGGRFMLAAMQVPAFDLERVAAIVNAEPAVAHNYEREHRFNLWFVLAAESDGALAATLERIETASGHPVLRFPKEREYFVEMMLAA